MFTEPRARRSWRRFQSRAELVLRPVPRKLRREVLDDLVTHVRDLVAQGPDDASEERKLQLALERMGDPQEFLAPLVGEDKVGSPGREVGLQSVRQAVLEMLKHGWRLTWHSATALVASVTASLALFVGIGGMIEPRAIGLFQVGSDEIELRLVGGGGGVPLFSPWFAVCLLVIAGVLAAFAWRLARQLFLESRSRWSIQ